MERNQVMNGLNGLCLVFNNHPNFDEGRTAEIWFEGLRNLQKEAFGKALYDITKTEEYFPKIATIRKYAEKYRIEEPFLPPVDNSIPARTPENLLEARRRLTSIARALEAVDHASMRKKSIHDPESCFVKYRPANDDPLTDFGTYFGRA